MQTERANNSTRAKREQEQKAAERYMILAATVPAILANLVNEAIEDGYRTAGGVMVDPRDGVFYQAVARLR